MEIQKRVQSSEKIEKALNKKKRSYYIVVNGNQTVFNLRYSPQLDLPGNFEIAMVSLDTYNFVPNVDSTNNSMKIYNGTALNIVTIPEGSYDIDAISSAIGLSQVSFSANTATLKSMVKITAPYKIDFDTPNSIASVLGFEKRIYETSSESAYAVNIMSVTNFKVVTNIVAGTYNNDKVDNVVYSFFPDVPTGYKILEKPMPIYLSVNTDRISELYVGLVDQNNKPINLRGETLTIRFHIGKFDFNVSF